MDDFNENKRTGIAALQHSDALDNLSVFQTDESNGFIQRFEDWDMKNIEMPTGTSINQSLDEVTPLHDRK